MFRRFRQARTAIPLFLLLPLSISNAVDIKISPLNLEDKGITCEVTVADSLPSNLTSYIKKGVPVSFDYRLELWRSRSGWLDKLIGNAGIAYRVRYDTWEKGYTIISEQSHLVVEHILEEDREAFDLVTSSGFLTMPVEEKSGEYYIVGKLTIKTMSLSNLKEVESWLKGEISGAKKPKIKDAPNKFSEFLFNTALKVSGLKNISEETRTPVFEINKGAIVFHEN